MYKAWSLFQEEKKGSMWKKLDQHNRVRYVDTSSLCKMVKRYI